MKYRTFQELSATCLTLLLFAQAPAARATVTNFSTPGTYTWTCPAGVTSIQVECWGGGGGATSPAGRAGGGGAGGSYVKNTSVSVVPITKYTVIVGWGGDPGGNTSGAGCKGGTGGSASFSGSSITPVIAGGGAGGEGGQSTNNGGGLGAIGSAAGNAGYSGSLNYAGGNGADGLSGNYGGGGGGAAGCCAEGGNASGTNCGVGTGLGGKGANGSKIQGTGTTGFAPGGGAAGGQSTGNYGAQGGIGGVGRVVLTICDGSLSANAGANQAVCAGSSVNIGGSPTASGGSGGYSYSWNPATGLSSTTVANPTAAPSSTTSYTVTVTDSQGCTATSSGITVTVNAVSVGGNASSSEVCSGNTGQVTLSGQTGAIQKWQSSPDHAVWTDIASTANPYTTPALTATTYYRAVVQSGVCSSASSAFGTITVNALPAAPDAARSRGPGCSLKIPIAGLGASAAVTDLGSGARGATITKDSTYIYYLPAPGNADNDVFTYTVTNVNGCQTTGSITVTVVKAEGVAQCITSSGGAVALSFAGIAGYSYAIQRATELGGNWTTLGTTSAPAAGVFQWLDDFHDLGVPPAAPPASAYYRLQQP